MIRHLTPIFHVVVFFLSKYSTNDFVDIEISYCNALATHQFIRLSHSHSSYKMLCLSIFQATACGSFLHSKNVQFVLADSTWAQTLAWYEFDIWIEAVAMCHFILSISPSHSLSIFRSNA